jgi:WD40 repeat protein
MIWLFIGSLCSMSVASDGLGTPVLVGEVVLRRPGVADMAFSPDGRTLAVVQGTDSISLWEIATSTCRGRLRTQDAVWRAAFNSSGRALFAAHEKGSKITIWELDTGRVMVRALGTDDEIAALLVTPNGKNLISSHASGTVKLWDLNTWRLAQVLRRQESSVFGAAGLQCAPDGKSIAIGVGTSRVPACGQIELWGIEGTLKKVVGKYTVTVSSLSYSSDGKWLAAASWRDDIRVFDAKSGTMTKELPRAMQAIRYVAFCKDNLLLVAGTAWSPQLMPSGEIQWWNIATGKVVSRLETGGEITVVASSPGHEILAVYAGGETIRLYNLSTLRAK